MCLAVPGELKTITDRDPLMPMGQVDFAGVFREVCLACVPEAVEGDYVLVHAGMAIAIVDRDEAAKVLALLESVS